MIDVYILVEELMDERTMHIHGVYQNRNDAHRELYKKEQELIEYIWKHHGKGIPVRYAVVVMPLK